MTTYLNYIIEANIGLVIFLAFYRLILSRKTPFPGKKYDVSRMNKKNITTPEPTLKEIIVVWLRQ